MNNDITLSPAWGLQRDITPRLGARLVQEGARLHFLADRANCVGAFTPEVADALNQTFPILIEQLEALLLSGELNPRHPHCVAAQHAGFICEADSLGSHGYVYIAIYLETPIA